MKVKNILHVILILIVAVIGYSYGHYVSEQNSLSSKYDDLHMNLTGELMIYDAIINGNGELVVPVVLSMISSNFSNMVELYNSGRPEQSEYVRCAITRKLRVLKEQGAVFSGETAEDDWGDKLAPIENYLVSDECPGQPSHPDWSEPDRLENLKKLESDNRGQEQ